MSSSLSIEPIYAEAHAKKMFSAVKYYVAILAHFHHIRTEKAYESVCKLMKALLHTAVAGHGWGAYGGQNRRDSSRGVQEDTRGVTKGHSPVQSQVQGTNKPLTSRSNGSETNSKRVEETNRKRIEAHIGEASAPRCMHVWRYL